MTTGALLLILFSIALSVPSLAIAEEKAPVRQYAWESECRHALQKDAGFTAQEKWAWSKRLCLGKTADMSEYGGGDGRRCDATDDDTWPETRRLSEKFLRTILFHEPFKSAPPRPHVRIRCALFGEEIDFSNFDLENEVRLERSRFKSRVTLSNSAFRRSLSVDESVFEEPLNMNGVRIKSYFMGRAATFAQLDLSRAQVDGPLYLSGSTVKGKLKLRRANIRRSLTLDTPSKHAPSRSQSEAWNNRQAEFGGTVMLQNAEVKHLLDMRGSIFRGKVNMRRVKVGKSLLMRSEARFLDSVIGHGAIVGGSLDIRDSEFHKSLDLAFVVVEEDFRIGKNKKCTTWGKGNGVTIRLTNARLRSLHDALCTEKGEQNLVHWPANIEFTGLSYVSLSGYKQTAAQTIGSRGADWFKSWLRRQHQYSPQPYRQLADVLEADGYGSTAIQVRVAGKNRELWETHNLARKFNLALQYLFIGYGYGTDIVAFWVILFTLLGSAVFRGTPKGAEKSLSYSLFYSFDRLIPIVKLSGDHYKEEPAGGARYYFFLHTLMGFVLGSYLVAGLTGLTN